MYAQPRREEGSRRVDLDKGETMTPLQGGNHMPSLGQFDGTGALSEFLWHFQLVADLKGWTEWDKGMYLGVSLSGSALKILESVDA